VRAEAQLLAGTRADDVPAVLARLGALQAQNRSALRLSVRARSSGLDVTTVDRALDVDRLAVTTWLMRRTLQLVAASDVRWMLGLLGPVFAPGGGPRRRKLGLDDALCARALDALPEVLADGPLTRDELVARLVAAGLDINPDGQAPAHLVGYAAMSGVICRGPQHCGGDAGPGGGGADQPTYVLLDSWVPPAEPWERDRALAELVRRYLLGHAPAGPEDFAAWSWLGLRTAREGFALADVPENPQDSGDVSAADRRPADEAASPAVRLVGHFDAYLLGYADRGFVAPAPFTSRVRTGGGFITPTVVVDGRAVATWRQQFAGDRLTVTVEPFDQADLPAEKTLLAEVEDLARFLGAVESRLRFTTYTAGAV
jgi:hypothetical protein